MNPKDPVLIQVSRANYAKVALIDSHIVDEIYMRDEAEDGLPGELAIRFYKFPSNRDSFSVQIGIFDEAWEWLGYEELWKALRDLNGEGEVTPLEVVDLLKRLGFRDITPETQPPTGKWATVARRERGS